MPGVEAELGHQPTQIPFAALPLLRATFSFIPCACHCALNAVNSSGTEIHKTAALASASRPPCKRIISTPRHTDGTSSD